MGDHDASSSDFQSRNAERWLTEEHGHSSWKSLNVKLNTSNSQVPPEI